MDAGAAHRLFSLLGGARHALLYAGGFHDAHAASLIALGEAFADDAADGRALRQRLAFVMVEAYQNIVRHRAPGAPAFFAALSGGARHRVFTANAIAASEAAALDEALQQLERSEEAQLKQLFLARLRSERRTERGGAGLGLIEMARRSGQPLRHRLLPLDAERRLFAMAVGLGGGDAGADDLEPCMDLWRTASQAGLVMGCRWGGSLAVQEAWLRLVEREWGAGCAAARAILAAEGWLRAGQADAGALVLLSGPAGARRMRIAWPADEAGMAALAQQAATVGAMPAYVLDRLYRAALLGQPGADGAHPAGLLELARIHRGPLVVEAGPGVASLSIRL